MTLQQQQSRSRSTYYSESQLQIDKELLNNSNLLYQIIQIIIYMLAIFIIILPLSNSQKCSCNEIYFEDLCQEARGCAYDVKSGFCEEIQCIDRMIDDCFYFAGKIRCYWDNNIGFCQELFGRKRYIQRIMFRNKLFLGLLRLNMCIKI
ncbi:unnamed protein product [Paramecium octaurelia]|uniref:Transmembrane protein n=1 Tax=Paramecium octaurelia TaxID=43137 RepID=A0A8S1T029_PAROT|nr:unnamed protein product [Paramecium octaurelia]